MVSGFMIVLEAYKLLDGFLNWMNSLHMISFIFLW